MIGPGHATAMAALPALAASLALSTCAGLTTVALVARVGPAFVRKGLKGIDMLKGYPANSQHLAMCVLSAFVTPAQCAR